jgi:hypothetical protein
MKKTLKTKSQKNCRNKGSYPNESRARILGAYKASGVDPLWPYACPECDGWHLTKLPQPGVRPIMPGASGILS